MVTEWKWTSLATIHTHLTVSSSDNEHTQANLHCLSDHIRKAEWCGGEKQSYKLYRKLSTVSLWLKVYNEKLTFSHITSVFWVFKGCVRQQCWAIACFSVCGTFDMLRTMWEKLWLGAQGVSGPECSVSMCIKTPALLSLHSSCIQSRLDHSGFKQTRVIAVGIQRAVSVLLKCPLSSIWTVLVLLYSTYLWLKQCTEVQL